MGYALVTGASGGIGKEFAKILAAHGKDLILVARSDDRLREIASELHRDHGVHVVRFAMDLTEEDAADQLFTTTQDAGYFVDTLINNAGFGDLTGFLDSNWHRSRSLMQLNMVTLAHLTYLYGNEMRRHHFGRILNVSSVAAAFAGPNMALYYASKAFVLSFTEALSAELRGTGVTATAICPGPTATAFGANARMSATGRNFMTMMRPMPASAVAARGYRAMMTGRTTVYVGPLTKAGFAAARILPRCVTRAICKYANGTPEGPKF
ncbi:MAG: SDR family oxidoreductase [Bifidobacteriaceae bacterium]|nr:SDR family oxidoreductase [Bifidobacteriaceae bacterium]